MRARRTSFFQSAFSSLWLRETTGLWVSCGFIYITLKQHNFTRKIVFVVLIMECVCHANLDSAMPLKWAWLVVSSQGALDKYYQSKQSLKINLCYLLFRSRSTYSRSPLIADDLAMSILMAPRAAKLSIRGTDRLLWPTYAVRSLHNVIRRRRVHRANEIVLCLTKQLLMRLCDVILYLVPSKYRFEAERVKSTVDSSQNVTVNRRNMVARNEQATQKGNQDE